MHYRLSIYRVPSVIWYYTHQYNDKGNSVWLTCIGHSIGWFPNLHIKHVNVKKHVNHKVVFAVILHQFIIIITQNWSRALNICRYKQQFLWYVLSRVCLICSLFAGISYMEYSFTGDLFTLCPRGYTYDLPWNFEWNMLGKMTSQSFSFLLTHWGRVTHICVSKLTIIGSDNGLSPGRCQAII